MFKHILVPLDGSKLAEYALAAATELARRFDSQITLLRVADVPYLLTQAHNSSFSELITSLRGSELAEATRYLKELQEELNHQELNVHYIIAEGEPVAEQILERVRRTGADTIVMSTHGWGGLRRWVYGSVADRVLRQADVPVLLIRGREEETTPPITVTIPPIQTFADIHTPATDPPENDKAE